MKEAKWIDVTKEEWDRIVRLFKERNPGFEFTGGVCGIGEPPFEYYSPKADGKQAFESNFRLFEILREWMGPNGEVDREGHKRFYKYSINTARVDIETGEFLG